MASVFLFANNAATTLAAPISNTATSLTVASGTGALFPSPSAGQQFSFTLNDAATGLLTEIVYCTARSGDTLSTIVRAQEGTVAQAWLAGDLGDNLLTAGQMAAMQQSSALFPARVVSGSGAFAMSRSDAAGGVGLLLTGAASTTLPAAALNGDVYWIEDLLDNFNNHNVTVNFPTTGSGQSTGPNGALSQVLNVSGQSAYFRYYSSSNIWSFNL